LGGSLYYYILYNITFKKLCFHGFAVKRLKHPILYPYITQKGRLFGHNRQSKSYTKNKKEEKEKS